MTSPVFDDEHVQYVPGFGRRVQWDPGQVLAYARAARQIHRPHPPRPWGVAPHPPFITRTQRDCAHCGQMWPCATTNWRRTVLTPELLRSRGRHSSRPVATAPLVLVGAAAVLAVAVGVLVI